MGVERVVCAFLLLFPAVLYGGKSFRVRTGVGTVIGIEGNWGDKVIHKFRGIPYAEAPVGPLRFRPPVPKAQFMRPFHADRFGSPCPQADEWLSWFVFSSEDKNLRMSEDCLSLNIYVPAGGERGKAVMVWIHGGSYNVGSGMMYDGSKMAAIGDVIVVTINYRLALLGSFTTTGDEEIQGNQMFLDQQLALKWVNNHIEYFGGDKKRVTLFGESAGGDSVTIQMLAPSNQGLFQRVISQSGTGLSSTGIPHPQVVWQYQKVFAERSGCQDGDFGKVLACLRTLPFERYKASPLAYPYSETVNGILAFGPRVDGDFIPFLPGSTEPGERLEDQRFFKSLDLMIGGNQYESSPFLGAIAEPPYRDQTNKSLWDGVPRETFQEMVRFIEAGGNDAATAFWWLYGTSEDIVKGGLMSPKGLMEFLGDAWSYDGTVRLTRSHANVTSKPTGSSYLYHFKARPRIVKGTLAEVLKPEPMVDGAMHGDELSFLFGRDNSVEELAVMEEGENDLSDAMITYWTNFAKTGNPNQPTPAPRNWPQYKVGEEEFIEFDILNKQPDFKIKSFFRNKYLSFWHDVLPILRKKTNMPSETCEKP